MPIDYSKKGFIWEGEHCEALAALGNDDKVRQPPLTVSLLVAVALLRSKVPITDLLEKYTTFSNSKTGIGPGWEFVFFDGQATEPYEPTLD